MKKGKAGGREGGRKKKHHTESQVRAAMQKLAE